MASWVHSHMQGGLAGAGGQPRDVGHRDRWGGFPTVCPPRWSRAWPRTAFHGMWVNQGHVPGAMEGREERACGSGGLREAGPEMVADTVPGSQGAIRTRTPVLQREAGPRPECTPPLPVLCHSLESARVFSPQAPRRAETLRGGGSSEALGLGRVASLGQSLSLQELVSKTRAIPGAHAGGGVGRGARAQGSHRGTGVGLGSSCICHVCASGCWVNGAEGPSGRIVLGL